MDDHWAEQLAAVRAHPSLPPSVKGALTALAERARFLAQAGVELEGIEELTKAALWIEVSSKKHMGLIDGKTEEERRGQLLRVRAFNLKLGYESLSERPDRLALWQVTEVDARFACAADRRTDLDDERGWRYGMLGKLSSATSSASDDVLDAFAMFVELCTPWTQAAEQQLAHLFARYEHLGACLAEGHPTFEAGPLCNRLYNYGLHKDPGTFSNLLAQVTPGWAPSNPDAVPGYRFVERLWNELFSNWVIENGSGWVMGLMRLDQLNGYTGPAQLWRRFDAEASLRPLRLAEVAKRQRVAALNLPPYVARKALPVPWLQEGQAGIQLLWNAPFAVQYSTICLEQVDGDGNLDQDYAGQNNRLLGTAHPGRLIITTGVNHGKVHLCIALCDEEPPPPDASWQELVEATYLLPTRLPEDEDDDDQDRELPKLGDVMGDVVEPLPIPPGVYRARLAVGRYGIPGKGTSKQPMERYALALWRVAEWPTDEAAVDALRDADAVLRVNHPRVREQHEELKSSQAKAGS